MSTKPRPLIHAIVLCDDIDVDRNGVTADLYAVRSHVVARQFPYIREQLCVYLEMSRSAGDSLANIVCVRAETDEEVFATPLRRLRLLGPLTIVSVVFRVKECPFVAPGTYHLQVFCDEEQIAEHRLTLIQGEVP